VSDAGDSGILLALLRPHHMHQGLDVAPDCYRFSQLVKLGIEAPYVSLETFAFSFEDFGI
jgi:hypothetical protein